VTSLATVVDGHDAIVSDIWGVLHNGVAPFPGAPEALAACRRSGRPVVLLSNAPRPASVIYAQLDRLGVPRTAYDAIVTSGDLARRLIAECASLPMLHIGPERDRPLFEGMTLDFRDAAAGTQQPPRSSSVPGSTTIRSRRPMTTGHSSPVFRRARFR
jgi:ribonucleotide monophosphatase NagD (HAD superfamily)